MLDTDSPYLSTPKGNFTIWRYMDLTKLLSLLESQKLLFPRSDQFEDPYEGNWTKLTVNSLREAHESWGTSDQSIQGFLSLREIARKEMFISCWSASEHESAAMWKIYLKSSEGVAIRSEYQVLAEALKVSPLVIRTSMVNYIDYEKSFFSIGDMFTPFWHKRISFSYEEEMRAFSWMKEMLNAPFFQADATSVSIDIDPQKLIKAVHVSPTAPSWFEHLVEQVLRRYGLSCPIHRSGLYDRPTY